MTSMAAHNDNHPLSQNLDPRLIRVSQKWLGKPNGCEKQISAVCGGAIASLMRGSSEFTRNPGIMALSAVYFSRKLSPAVTRKDVRRVVKACQLCQSIDPAPVKWARGSSMLMRSDTG